MTPSLPLPPHLSSFLCSVFGGNDRWGWNLAAPASTEQQRPRRQLATRPLHLAHAFDIIEKPEAFELVADAPGFTNDDITITLDDDRTLTVSGKLDEKKEETTGEGGRKVWRSERRSQQFTRSFTLPENTKPEEICASLDKGVLTVCIPKQPEAPKAEPRRIEVKAS